MTRWSKLLIALLLGTALAACTPSSYVPFYDTPSPEVVTDPPPTQVAKALRFGALAPLPPGTRVVALKHQPYRDESFHLAIRMPVGSVEPYLIASGLGPFDEFSSIAGETVYGTTLPNSAPAPTPDYLINDLGDGVFREAGTEPAGDGDALVHIRLATI